MDPRGDSRVDPQTTLTVLDEIHCQQQDRRVKKTDINLFLQ